MKTNFVYVTILFYFLHSSCYSTPAGDRNGQQLNFGNLFGGQSNNDNNPLGDFFGGLLGQGNQQQNNNSSQGSNNENPVTKMFEKLLELLRCQGNQRCLRSCLQEAKDKMEPYKTRTEESKRQSVGLGADHSSLGDTGADFDGICSIFQELEECIDTCGSCGIMKEMNTATIRAMDYPCFTRPDDFKKELSCIKTINNGNCSSQCGGKEGNEEIVTRFLDIPMFDGNTFSLAGHSKFFDDMCIGMSCISDCLITASNQKCGSKNAGLLLANWDIDIMKYTKKLYAEHGQNLGQFNFQFGKSCNDIIERENNEWKLVLV